MSLKIGVIKGDGIGPEIVTEAMKVLDKAGEVYGFDCSYEQLLLGGASIDVHGVPLTDETVAKAKACDAVLMGSIGGDAGTVKETGGRSSEDQKRTEPVRKSASGGFV